MRKHTGTCSAEDCDRPIKSVEWCTMHYQRVRLFGDPFGKSCCSVDGCTKPAWDNPMCRGHWRNLQTNGDPLAFPTCKIETCEKVAPSGKRGWCQMHYTRWSRNGDPGDPESLRWGADRTVKDGHRWCRMCRLELPDTEFCKNQQSPDGLATYCRECTAIRKLAENYGISGETYQEILTDQGGVCKTCKCPETAKHQSGRVRRLSVDHDHTCCPGKKSCGKCVRGLLCARCNSMLGMCDDDTSVLLSLVDYLITRQENHADDEHGRRSGSD